jgi:FkbM family methyltransferase
MPWISYAQNREDVLLKRALRDVKTGFYVDVGAYHPVDVSITKHFYDSGWNGINVEPSPAQYAIVAQARPRDINVNVAVSDHIGAMTFYEALEGTRGLSTLAAEEAERHKRNGFRFREHDVPVVTLAELLDRHAGQRTVDFMSVDVEGHERAVLAGGDWRRWRPRIVVVEATRPLSMEQTHGQWEGILLDAGYLLATFDGLNRYYVREEDRARIGDLVVPANVFDAYVPWEQQKRIEELEAQLAELRGTAGGRLRHWASRATKGLVAAASALRHSRR